MTLFVMLAKRRCPHCIALRIMAYATAAAGHHRQLHKLVSRPSTVTINE